MRVDASQVLAGSGVNLKSTLSAVTDSLKEGDEPIKGTGDDDLSLGEKSLVREFNDKSLAPFAAKLAELKMPVTEESARAMRDIMAQNPKLSMDEAAFLASNKLTGDDSLMKAALEVLSGGDKTDAMIAKLLSSLNSHEPANPDAGLRSVSAQTAAPLTDLITFIVKSAAAPITIITQPDDNMQLNVRNTESFFTQDVENATRFSQNATENSQNSDNIQQNIAQETKPDVPPPLQEAMQPGQPQPQGEVQGNLSDKVPAQEALPNEQPVTQGTEKPVTTATQNPVENTPVQGEVRSETPGKPVENTPVPQTAQETQKTPNAPSTSNTVAELLSQVPEFKGTPHSALERFSNMLLRVAGDGEAATITDGASEADKDTKMLADQLNKMFTKIDRNDADAGARLREAREELFARLSLIEEEIARSSGPQKEVLLAQTQKLMDHVRLLNNIDQFHYLQLPVQLKEEQKSAELYIFKRKGGKRADPDNVNILLAIDLEFMGHWEALLNIKGKDVTINMEVQGEDEKNHFMSQTVLLHEMLSEEGFKLVNTNIKISKEETTPLTALLALDRYTGGHQGKIDFFY